MSFLGARICGIAGQWPEIAPNGKRGSSAEEDRLRQLLLRAAKALQPVDPKLAAELLEQVYPAGDPDDGLEGYYDGEAVEKELEAEERLR